MRENVAREAALMTDESALYAEVGAEFASHETVCHSAEEYVRGDVHTNTMDGYWGLFKRGMRGVYQHCGEQHLQRYLDEFSFRHNARSKLGVEDTQRAALAIKGMSGKRLYRPRLLRHRAAAYAASAAVESWSCRTALGGLKPCRSISRVAL